MGAHVANIEVIWSILINNIGNDNPQPCNYLPELEDEILESPPPPEPHFFQQPPPLRSPPPNSPSFHNSPPPKAHNTSYNFRIRKLYEIFENDPS